jgi:excinuclease ABC subunit B
MSNVIAEFGWPTLVLVNNKTLASQLARELRLFFNENSVELFVSYYNIYIPKLFVETTGTYIAKQNSANNEIDALQNRATRSLLERRDVIVVASVSCIYGLGLPAEYLDAFTSIAASNEVVLSDFIHKLETALYA